MKSPIFTLFTLLLLVLAGCQQESRTGISGNDNDNNQIAITDTGDIINEGDVNINESPKTIAQTGIIPEDILTKIHPGISVAFAKELLGEANIRDQYDNSPITYVWNFSNASIQIMTEDDNSIDVVTLVNPSPTSTDKFDIYPLGYSLGSLTPSDLECGTPPEKDYSSKFYSLSITCYFGNPGNYFYFEFGAFEGGKVQYGGDMVAYGGEIADNFWTQPFNYVSIAYSEEETTSIYWSYLR
jgi:hypothetical protein